MRPQNERDIMSTQNERNARFWTWNNGPVKITLRPGQRLTWRQTVPTDEGWSSEEETWHLDNGVVICNATSDGVDCDGRHTRYDESHCVIDQLQVVRIEEDDSGMLWPHWVPGHRSQLDAYAETMGY